MVAHPAQESGMISSKECFKCKTDKPLEEFYRHKMMADGHLNKCKACAKFDVSKNRQDNLESKREYDRERSRLSHRMELRARVTKAWRAEDLRRQQCHNAVRRAILDGRLVKSPCTRCGEVKSLAHHEDYDKPLDVMWLCQPCHKQRHKELKEEF
jgi:ribosomal protein S27AE